MPPFLSGLFKKKEVPAKPPLREAMGDFKAPTGVITPDPIKDAPAGVDFSALWEEPEDPSKMAAILSGVAAVISFITLIVLFFHK